MPSKKNNEKDQEIKEKPIIFEGIKTDRDDGIGGVAATMVWTRNKTPAEVRAYWEAPAGLLHREAPVGQQKKRGYNIPETPREKKSIKDDEGTVAGAMYGWAGDRKNHEAEGNTLDISQDKTEHTPNTRQSNKDCKINISKFEEEDDLLPIMPPADENDTSRTEARGTQTTASLKHRPKPNAAPQKPARGSKKDDDDMYLWKMSRFTKNAKPCINTHRGNKK